MDWLKFYGENWLWINPAMFALFSLTAIGSCRLYAWWWDRWHRRQVIKLVPTQEELTQSLKRYPAPQEWYDEDHDDLC